TGPCAPGPVGYSGQRYNSTQDYWELRAPTQLGQTKRSRKPAMVQSPGSVQNEVRDTSQGTAFISAIDGGLPSLAMIAGYYRIACDPAQMAHDLGLGHRASNAEDIVRAARRLGLKARALPDQTPKRLRSAPLPGILQMRVLVHNGGSTLIVIVVGLVAIGLFDATLQYLRSYVLNHTTSRIDCGVKVIPRASVTETTEIN